MIVIVVPGGWRTAFGTGGIRRVESVTLRDEGPVLVTGAAGLIGQAVARRLAARGTEVVAIDRVGGNFDGVAVRECDLTDPHRLHALAGGALGGVVHCGAFSGPMVARDAPYAMTQVNIVGTANVLEVARIHGARRFVYASSSSVYGITGPAPVTETDLPNPATMYGASKASSELLVSAYDRQYGLSSVSIRLCWVYGPRRVTDCVIRTMLDDARHGRPTRLGFGDDFHRQFIHVDDAARALITALDADDPPARVYNATGGTRHTLTEIGQLVTAVIPTARIELAPGPDPADEPQELISTAAIARDLGFHPQVSLPDGIAAYARWLAQH